MNNLTLLNQLFYSNCVHLIRELEIKLTYYLLIHFMLSIHTNIRNTVTVYLSGHQI